MGGDRGTILTGTVCAASDVHGVDVERRRRELPLGPRARGAHARLLVRRVQLRVERGHEVVPLRLGDGRDVFVPINAAHAVSAGWKFQGKDRRAGLLTMLLGRGATLPLGRKSSVRWKSSVRRL